MAARSPRKRKAKQRSRASPSVVAESAATQAPVAAPERPNELELHVERRWRRFGYAVLGAAFVILCLRLDYPNRYIHDEVYRPCLSWRG
jgi:hypothetical protein